MGGQGAGAGRGRVGGGAGGKALMFCLPVVGGEGAGGRGQGGYAIIPRAVSQPCQFHEMGGGGMGWDSEAVFCAR